MRNAQFLEKEPSQGWRLEFSHLSIRFHSPVGRACLCPLLSIKNLPKPYYVICTLLRQLTEICSEGFFYYQGICRKQGQRRASISTVMTLLEKMLKHMQSAGEHSKKMVSSSWRVEAAGRTRWEGRSSKGCAHLTCTFLKKLTAVEEQRKDRTAGVRMGREFRKHLCSTAQQLLMP